MRHVVQQRVTVAVVVVDHGDGRHDRGNEPDHRDGDHDLDGLDHVAHRNR
jgi:hypothetical protein